MSSKFGSPSSWVGANLYEVIRLKDDALTAKIIGTYGLNKVNDGHIGHNIRPKKWHHLCLSYNGHLQTMSGVLVSYM